MYYLDFLLFLQQSNTATLFGKLFSSEKADHQKTQVFLADWPIATANTDSL